MAQQNNTPSSSFMDRLKENKTGVIAAVAAGALAIGYLIYASSSKAKGVADDADDAALECEPTEEIQNFFFLDEKLSEEDQEKEINKWVKD